MLSPIHPRYTGELEGSRAPARRLVLGDIRGGVAFMGNEASARGWAGLSVFVRGRRATDRHSALVSERESERGEHDAVSSPVLMDADRTSVCALASGVAAPTSRPTSAPRYCLADGVREPPSYETRRRK